MNGKTIRILAAIGLLVIAVLAIIIIRNNRPATMETIYVAGAKPTFDNATVQQILADKYHVRVEVVTNSDLLNIKNQQGTVDFSGVSVVFGGNASFGDELKAKYPKGIPTSGSTPIQILLTQTVFQSPLIPFVKSTDIPAFVNAGIFVKNGEVYTVSGEKMLVMINAAKNDLYWKDINVQIPGKVRFGFSNPMDSSGGRNTIALLISCQETSTSKYYVPCSETVTPSNVGNYKDFIIKIWEDSGKKPGDDNSVSFFYDWANSSNAAERIVFAQESAPFSWMSTMSPERQTLAKESLVGVYPEFTYMVTQTAVAFDEKGKKLVEWMTTDPDLVAAANTQLGMRVGQANSLPGKMAKWLCQGNCFTTVPDPLPAVPTAIKDLIKSVQ